MEINSYCLRPAGCWEQNEVSYYLETQILKKIRPCATPGATRLSLTRSVVMEPSPSEIKTHLNKNKTTKCRIGLSRNFTDYFSTLYKYEELFSCLANNTELFTRLTEMRQENPEQKVLRGEQCHIFINSDIHFNERSQIILSQDVERHNPVSQVLESFNLSANSPEKNFSDRVYCKRCKVGGKYGDGISFTNLLRS